MCFLIASKNPLGDFVLSGVSICASPNLDIHGVKSNCKPTFENQVRGRYCVLCLPDNYILRLVTPIFVDTSLLLRNLFSQSSSIVLRWEDQMQTVTFRFSSAGCVRWPGFALMVCSRLVIDVILLDCASTKVWHTLATTLELCQGHTRQTVVCHHAYVCLSWLVVICQSRPHYISENQTSACQTTM